jgi:hypothetical protein
MKNITPTAQTSDAYPLYLSFAHISGDIYAGVPQKICIFYDD